MLLSGCLYFVRYWTICVLWLFINQIAASWILNLILNLSNQAFYLQDEKVMKKSLNILRMKRAFKMKQNAFFMIFKGLAMKQIAQFLWKVKNFKALLVSKRLLNRVSMQFPLFANNCWNKQNQETYPALLVIPCVSCDTLHYLW